MNAESRLRVVVATPDVVGERMAGPGIRALHFARQLSEIADVTLIAKFGGEEMRSAGVLPGGNDEPFAVAEHGSQAARDSSHAADVLIGQPARGFFRRRRGQKIVYDLFDPLVLELRELYGSAPAVRQRIHLAAEWMRLVLALRSGDLLVCAAAQQLEFYRQLQSNDVPWIEVPFGIDPAEVKRCEPARDNLVVWGGGAWEWLDPRLAVDAIVALNREGLRCRLLFLGRGRPNQQVVERRREDRFDALLAAGAPFVDANPGWIAYRERLSWLRQGKVAIMLHRSTAEAEYSIRTRLFDAIAGGVPVVATAGGFAAELVRHEQLGIVVPPGDAGAVTSAVRRLLTDGVFHAACVQNLERIRPQFWWSSVTRPLVDAVVRWQRQRP